MSFNTIRENKTLAKFSEFTVYCWLASYVHICIFFAKSKPWDSVDGMLMSLCIY